MDAELHAYEEQTNVIGSAVQDGQDRLQGLLSGLVMGVCSGAKCRQRHGSRVEGGCLSEVCGRSDDAVVLVGEQVESVVVSLYGGALIGERLVGSDGRGDLVERAVGEVGVGAFCRDGSCVCLSNKLGRRVVESVDAAELVSRLILRY